MVRWIAASATLLALLSGCLAGDPAGSREGGDLAAPPAEAPALGGALGFSSLERSYAGTILLRPLDDPMYLGDAPHQCFHVPVGTAALHAVLDWDTPQHMGMDFSTVDGKNYTNSWGETLAALDDVVAPIAMTLERPVSDDWVVYAGPTLVGGPVNWSLTLTFEVERDGVPVGETYVPDGFDCPT